MRSKDNDEFMRSFTPTAITRRTFDVGTKVFISDRGHPAYGETGRVVTAPRDVHGIVKGIWAEVEIDGWAGHRCGVQPHQMRALE